MSQQTTQSCSPPIEANSSEKQAPLTKCPPLEGRGRCWHPVWGPSRTDLPCIWTLTLQDTGMHLRHMPSVLLNLSQFLMCKSRKVKIFRMVHDKNSSCSTENAMNLPYISDFCHERYQQDWPAEFTQINWKINLAPCSNFWALKLMTLWVSMQNWQGGTFKAENGTSVKSLAVRVNH